jgi:murein DD-endopeptidase MepM/ murein hydrolase activator NlpD
MTQLILPAVLLAACSTTPVSILSPYGSRWSYLGYPYPGAPYHEGVDIAGPVGEPILAVADGMVVRVGEDAGDSSRCGIGVLTREFDFGRLIRYCHLSAHTVTPGQQVKRGEVIGYLGATGNAGPVAHIHWEVRDLKGTPEDPLPLTVGCFDPAKTYPTDRFVLTYPVKCESKQ